MVLRVEDFGELPLHLGVIDFGQLAPVFEPVAAAADPVDGLFLEKAVALPGGLTGPDKVHNGLVPGLFQDGRGQAPFGAGVGMNGRSRGIVMKSSVSHLRIIPQ
jgi:hypothetical protein